MPDYSGKYLDGNGVSHLWAKIKLYFAPISHTHSYGDITNPPAIPTANSTAENIKVDGTQSAGSLSSYARADHVHPTDTSRAAASHAHGNITSGGDITATAPTVATGDKLIINDESASKITNGPSFDTSDAAKYLRHDGTWAVPPDSDTTYDISTTGSGTNRKLNLLEDGVQITQVNIPDTNTTYSDFTGATSSADGAPGLVPAPISGEQDSILFGDGDWDILDLSTVAGQDSNSNPVIYISLKKHDSSGHLLGSVQLDPATTSSIGLMTAADKTKLNGIATGAEVNQNAFSQFKVGDTYIAADGKTDTLTLVAGSNVTITPDATNDKVTIAATDTTYSDFTGATSSAAGTHGLVPAPGSGRNTSFLRGDGDWWYIGIIADNALVMDTNASSKSVTIGHKAYTEASAAAIKVGRDATGHVVTGSALTASDVGAAASSHNHAAGDITSGTLGVARGGTGASTLGAGVVYHSASGTGALSIATAANLVSALGTTAVNRATADASGNNIADTYAKKSDITNAYRYKGSVAAAANLPTTGQTAGDVYNIEAESTYGPAGTNVAWVAASGSVDAHWDALGGAFTITALTTTEIDAIVAAA